MNKTSNSDVQYCAITEQGDLGLGAEILCESDQKIMRKNAEKEAKEKE